MTGAVPPLGLRSQHHRVADDVETTRTSIQAVPRLRPSAIQRSPAARVASLYSWQTFVHRGWHEQGEPVVLRFTADDWVTLPTRR